MQSSILRDLGAQLKQARKAKRLTQPQLAARLGRDRARISELERDLLAERRGRDRLALLAEICEVLDLTPLLVPSAKAAAIRSSIDPQPARPVAGEPRSSTFDEVFVDLGDENEA